MPADLNDYFNKNKKNSENGEGAKFRPNLQNFNGFGKFGGFFYFIIAIIALFVIAKPFVTIQSGEVGVKSNLGKYDPTPLGAGIHFFVPFIQDVFIIDTRVRIINYTSNEDMATSRASGGNIGGIIRKNS